MRLAACALALAASALSSTATAASGGAPITVAHAGYVLDAFDQPLNGATAFTFRVFDGASALQWEGACGAVQVRAGYYSVPLGDPAVCTGSSAGGLDPVLDTSDLPPGEERSLELVVAGITMTPRLTIGSVPTASVAARSITADTLGAHPAEDFALAAHTHDSSAITDFADAAVAAVAADGRFLEGATPVEALAVLVSTSTSSPRWASGTTANRLLRTDGLSVDFAQAQLETDVAGTLPVANGGTGQSWFTDGQILIGSTATGALTKTTLTAGSGIAITNGDGQITIAAASTVPGVFHQDLGTLAPGAASTVTHNLGTTWVSVSLLVSDNGGATFRVVPPAGSPTPSTFGDGSDGPLSLAAGSGTTVTNTVRSALGANASAGATQLTLATPTGFAAGQRLLVIQQQGTGAGSWEHVAVASVSGSVATLATPLANTYTTTGGSKAQVVKVMQFSTLTIGSGATLTPPAWDGASGGILDVWVAGALQLDGSIDATAKGYRGAPQASGSQGESYTTTVTQAQGANGGGGGAGQNICCGQRGGGGGGFAGGGGSAPGTGGSGGGTYGDAAFTTLWLGSGGGGGAHSGCNSSNPAFGGNGGGLVLVWARNLVQNGSITSGGGTGNNDASGGGGGGSGGQIWVRSATNSGSGGTSVAGGGGGADTSGCDGSGGVGGGGGSGRTRVDTSVSVPAGGLEVSVPGANTVVITNSATQAVRVRAIVSGTP